MKADLSSEKMKSAGLAVLIKTKEKQLAGAQSSLKDQKEALEGLLEDTEAGELEEKAKYIALMKELEGKVQEVNKRQADLSEKEVRGLAAVVRA